MKRTMCLLLALLLCLSLMPMQVFAVESMNVKVSEVSGKAGEQVELTVSVENNSGFAYANFTIDYDKSRLQLNGIADSGITGWGFVADTGLVAWDDDHDFTGDGEVLKLKFTILENAPAGKATVSIKSSPSSGGVDFADFDENVVAYAVTSGGVNVDGDACADRHDWDEGVITTAPTCTVEGVRTYRCNVCGETRTEAVEALGHDYASEFTIDKAPTLTEEGSKSRHCVRCDEKTDITSIPMLMPFETSLEIALERAKPGEVVEIPVSVVNNAGISGITIQVEYDSSKLSLVGYRDGALTNWETYGSFFSWADIKDFNEDGIILTLQFKVNEEAEDGNTIINSIIEEAINIDEKPIPIEVVPGGINIKTRIPGDANGDGKVSLIDAVRIRRYLVHDPSVELDILNADVNGDGKVTLIDVVRIRRFLVHDPSVELN